MGKTLVKTQEFERVGYLWRIPIIIVVAVIIGAYFVKEELVLKGERNRVYTVEVPVICAIEFIFAQKMMRDHWSVIN